MNTLKVEVSKIENIENLNIVSFTLKQQQLKMMSLDLPKNMQINSQVTLGFKASSVAIAKEFTGELSYSNQLPVNIKKIDLGELLCSLTLSFETSLFESIITADAAKRLRLKEGDQVLALIKSSDISLLEVLS